MERRVPLGAPAEQPLGGCALSSLRSVRVAVLPSSGRLIKIGVLWLQVPPQVLWCRGESALLPGDFG